jgi:hypothetical protein
MDVTGTAGEAFYKGEGVGAFVLKGGRGIGSTGRPTEHVEIQFLDPLPQGLRAMLEIIVQREQRLPEPLIVDLELESGQRMDGCEISGFWGGRLGKRWFGINLDLDQLD